MACRVRNGTGEGGEAQGRDAVAGVFGGRVGALDVSSPLAVVVSFSLCADVEETVLRWRDRGGEEGE